MIKPATDSPWRGRLLVECLRDAGLPPGVANYVTGPGNTLGQALIDHPEVAGIAFTGSKEVGMAVYRSPAQQSWVRPTILEMGGKNPAIVSRYANLDDGAKGIVGSAFGLLPPLTGKVPARVVLDSVPATKAGLKKAPRLHPVEGFGTAGWRPSLARICTILIFGA